jgi:V/A-type H+-transporting ATPase subunit K
MIEALLESMVLLQAAGEGLSDEAAQAVAETDAEALTGAAAAIGVGLSAIGAGYAERGIGSAAVGAMAEDPDMFGRGLLMTVLPETLVIFAIVVIFLV